MEACLQKLEGVCHLYQRVSWGFKILSDLSSALLGPPPSCGSPRASVAKCSSSLHFHTERKRSSCVFLDNSYNLYSGVSSDSQKSFVSYFIYSIVSWLRWILWGRVEDGETQSGAEICPEFRRAVYDWLAPVSSTSVSIWLIRAWRCEANMLEDQFSDFGVNKNNQGKFKNCNSCALIPKILF